MSEPREMILMIKSTDTIRDIRYNKDSSEELTIAISTGKIESITLTSKAVLSIKFNNGELLLDIDDSELKKIEYKD